MRPLKLRLSAFGPFASPTEVDFTAFEGAPLLLIHGQTGGGKTTLLDAMCFALYGETSGSERSAKEMKSHHAPAAAKAEVTFEFSVRGRVYCVERAFRASGKAQFSLSLLKDGAWQTLASKAQEVEARVEEIIGLDARQFRQVVLLPQGRFRDFLVASSRERESILESLFDTARYREIEDALREAAAEVQRELQVIERRQDGVLEQAGVNSRDQLVDERREAMAHSRSLEVDIASARAVLAEAETTHLRARELCERFLEWEAARAELAQLETGALEWEQRSKRLALARRAVEVGPLARSAEEARMREERAEERRKKAAERVAGLAEALQQAEVGFAAEQVRQAAVPALREEHQRLLVLKARLFDVEAARRALDQAERLLREAEQAHERAASKLAALERRRGELRSAYEATTEAARVIEREGELLRSLTARCEAAERLVAVKQSVRDLDEALAQAEYDERAADEEEQRTRTELLDAEDAWLSDVVGQLAADLDDGAPCPVCGGREHPAPAAASKSPLERDDLLRRRTVHEEAQRRALEARERRARSEAEARVLRAEVVALEHSVGSEGHEALFARREACAATIAGAEEVLAGRAALEDDVSHVELLLQDAAQAMREATRTQDERRLARASAEAVWKTCSADVPLELSDRRALAERLTDIDAELAGLEAAKARASLALRAAETGLVGASASLEAAAAEEAGAANERAARTAELSVALERAGFASEADFRDAHLDADARESLEEALREHDARTRAARARIERATAAIDGLERPLLDDTERDLRDARDALEMQHRALGSISARLTQLDAFIVDLDGAERALEKLRERHRVVGRLSRMATGDHPGRITFQRWVLAALLDDVLASASQRLGLMTRGRYTLKRLTEASDKRRSQGLDLAVLDSYTGSERAVSTLSGGESFLAALALALGLADAVQARAGGIELEAIFIDEGFGGLDPEALDLALEALMRLKDSGRLVGIISHVAELKERIDARLEVVPSRGGSALRVA